jgi:hypothetical protein
MRFKHEFLPMASLDPSFPWPIPEEGAEIEVARYRRENTSSKNSVDRMFFVRVRILSTELLKYIEFRSYWRERDVVTEREFYDFPIAGG